MANKQGRQPTVDSVIAKIEKLEIQIKSMKARLEAKGLELDKHSSRLTQLMTTKNKPQLTALLDNRRAGLEKLAGLLDKIPDNESDAEFEETKPPKSKKRVKDKNRSKPCEV